MFTIKILLFNDDPAHLINNSKQSISAVENQQLSTCTLRTAVYYRNEKLPV
jgi:hypothetical protein